MDKLKFMLFSIITLSLVGIFGYWSVSTIQSGTEHAVDQKIKQLEKENEDLRKEVKEQKSEFSVLQSKLSKLEEIAPSVVKEIEVPKITVYKYQVLIDELQKLIDGKVLLKEKSVGSKVGTVQKFLNIYNNTSIKVDNGYGAGTVKAVIDFQKDVGLNADGEAGSSTFSKMIDWLKKLM